MNIMLIFMCTSLLCLIMVVLIMLMGLLYETKKEKSDH
jgi:fucose permease